MIIIHGMDTLPRLLGDALAIHLTAMPVVVLTGARQSGKSTLVLALAGPRSYWSLDDLDVRDAARRDPAQLVGGQRAVSNSGWEPGMRCWRRKTRTGPRCWNARRRPKRRGSR